MFAQQNASTVKSGFGQGDYVLYRDPARFWRGLPDHTFVCRIETAWATGTYNLTALATGSTVYDARPEYMRLLPPVDAMRDIDTAPLNTDGAADDMTAAAMCWLTQQQATANRRPELPGQS
ncbi:hypothetical protein ABT354_36065 [Streptomyces sp. NPDC000594]|uniref:hypothetical protein n=1 Tax=Streptomyces sp. NPDC000594 TaxID=3154261 RepID=UPI003317A1A8